MTFDTKATFSADGTFNPDALVAGNAHLLVGKKITLLHGEVRTRGAVLGAITAGAVTAAAKGGGNTGNGTCTALSAGAHAQVGVYQVRVVIGDLALTDSGSDTIASTNAAVLNLYAPDGKLIDQKQYAGSGATAIFANDQVHATITDGATDFIVGDGFDITVAAGSSKYKLSAAAAVDGSAVPDVILAEDCDATAADKEALAYMRGDFNANSLTLGAGHTVASITETLRGKGITLLSAMA